MSKRLFVIITAPHSFCVSKKERDCDITSLDSSKRLSKSFKKEKYKIPHTLLISDKLRSDFDLNRIESSRTKFHQNLNKIIRIKKKVKGTILLDVHSGDFGNENFIILVQKNFECHSLLYEIEKRTNATIKTGNKDNYIVNKSLRNKIPSLLLEFNERNKYYQSFFDKIALGVLNWYKRI